MLLRTAVRECFTIIMSLLKSLKGIEVHLENNYHSLFDFFVSKPTSSETVNGICHGGITDN